MSRYKTFQQLPLISLGVVHKLYWEARGKARVHEQTNNSTTKRKNGGGAHPLERESCHHGPLDPLQP